MSELHSTGDPASSKPAKPYPDLPLFPHASGQWAQKIRGRFVYFGPWNNPDVALAKYLAAKDDLHAGRTPRPEPGALSLKDLANAFLNAKQAMVDTGELSPRTWDGYKSACDFLVKHLGKTRLVADLGPDDFAAVRTKLAQRYGPHGLGTAIQCIRCACKYACFSAVGSAAAVGGSDGFGRGRYFSWFSPNAIALTDSTLSRTYVIAKRYRT